MSRPDLQIVINVSVPAVVLATLVLAAFWLGYEGLGGWSGASAQAGLLSLGTVVARVAQGKPSKGRKKKT